MSNQNDAHHAGPVFRSNDAPRYVKAFVVHIVVYGVQLVTIVALRIRLMRLNAIKRRAQGLAISEGEEAVSCSFCSSGVICPDRRIERDHIP